MGSELWQFRYSHYNEKVRWALDHKRWGHERHTLAPGFHIPRALQLTGQPLTPILRVDGLTLTDSTKIIAYLEEQQPEPALYPSDPEKLGRALALEDWFDEEVGDDVRRLFYHCYATEPGACARMSTAGTSSFQQRAFHALMPVLRHVIRLNMAVTPGRVAQAQRGLPSYFDKIMQEVGPSGYLVGDTFSVADLTAAAMLSLIVGPEQFPYALPDAAPTGLLELRDQLANHEGFSWVREIYAKHRPPEKSVLNP